MSKKGRIIQNHHLFSEWFWKEFLKDDTTRIYKGEHAALTNIQLWCSHSVSKGFIRALKIYIAIFEDRAIDLESIEKEMKNVENKS